MMIIDSLLEPKEFDFDDKLKFSKGQQLESDHATILKYLHGCVKVENADLQTDRSGIDYIATLDHGAKVLIDAKTREAGCKKFWRKEPDLALEIWSVMPRELDPYGFDNDGKIGWTRCRKRITDMIFFKYQLQDTDDVFFFPFQQLRIAFEANLEHWCDIYKMAPQKNRPRPGGKGWTGQCVFVPVSVAKAAISKIMDGKRIL